MPTIIHPPLPRSLPLVSLLRLQLLHLPQTSSSANNSSVGFIVIVQRCPFDTDRSLPDFPEGTSILSVTPSGTSAWVQTVRIETRQEDGDIKLYFLKARAMDLMLLGPLLIVCRSHKAEKRVGK